MKKILLIVFIFLIAIIFRFYGLDWDQGTYLHPDERFLGFVGNAMNVPKGFFEYLSPNISPMNPTNVGYPFFVYGIFPIVINKLLAITLQNNTFYGFIHQGRFLSAFFDILTLIVVYKTAMLLKKEYNLADSLPYFATFLYAVSVLPIQLAHFFAVDTFLNFFMLASFYFMMRFYFNKNIFFVLLSAAFLGLAISSKITGIFALPLLLFIYFACITKSFTENLLILSLRSILLLCCFCITCYFTIHIADPYYFQSGNLLNPIINKQFIENIKALRNFDDPRGWFPPGIQWQNKTPVIFSIINLAVFGVGIPFFLLIIMGFSTIIRHKHKKILPGMFIWVLLYFLYQSSQFSQPMRYFLPLYPYLALFAAIGLTTFVKLNIIYNIFLLILLLIWPLSFFSIYTKQHSRVMASQWIFQSLPSNSILLSEHWDDGLPLALPNIPNKKFTIEELPVFGPDTDEKWQQMTELLNRGDFYILSSNRGWGSIIGIPNKYPRMSKFYKDLFSEKLQYKKIAEFTSYPSLRYLGIPIDFPDDWADESFTVYDHPKVIIFKKMP